MSEPSPLSMRLVLDTNVLLRGLLNSNSASGRILEIVDRRAVVALLSKPVLAEYVAFLTDDDLVGRHPELTLEKV